MFTGEEQGLSGPKEYVEAHKDELDKISGALFTTPAPGRVLAIGLHDNYQDREIVDQVLAPLGELKIARADAWCATYRHGSRLSFDEVGRAGILVHAGRCRISLTHHSQSDTFDKVWKDDLNQGAQVLATWAYNTAQLPRMLPRRPLSLMATAAEKTEAPKDPVAETDKKIVEQVKLDSELLKADLTYLTTRSGRG